MNSITFVLSLYALKSGISLIWFMKFTLCKTVPFGIRDMAGLSPVLSQKYNLAKSSSLTYRALFITGDTESISLKKQIPKKQNMPPTKKISTNIYHK